MTKPVTEPHGFWEKLSWATLPLRPWVDTLFGFPLLTAMVSLVVGIVAFDVGRDYGLPNLFWADDFGTAAVAGAATVAMLGKVWFIKYLLDVHRPGRSWMTRRSAEPGHVEAAADAPGRGRTVGDILNAVGWFLVPASPFGEVPGRRSVRWYMAVTWLPCLVVIALSALCPIHESSSRLGFLTGLALGIAWVRLLPEAVGRLNTWLGGYSPISAFRRAAAAGLRRQAAHSETDPAAGAGREEISLHALATTFFALLAVLYLFNCLFLQAWISPAVALCLLLGIVVSIYGAIRIYVQRWFFGAIGGVVILVAMGESPDYKNRFRNLENYYPGGADGPVDLSVAPATPPDAVKRYDSHAVFKTWAESLRKPGGQKPKLVLVATSGGGVRAGVWTVVTLAKLEEQFKAEDVPFSHHVRVMSGASGGMVGAGFWASTLQPDGSHAVSPKGGTITLTGEQLVDRMGVDTLGAIARTWAVRDVPRAFWPGSTTDDRGGALETAWDDADGLAGAMSIDFPGLAAGEVAGWRPSLIYSPMIVEDGRRLLISNLDVDPLTKSGGSVLLRPGLPRQPYVYSLSAVEFFRYFPKAAGFRLSTAARMSASFPYVSPSSDLPTVPVRRVVDAGYYDNYGVDVAASWLFEHAQDIRDLTSGVVLIQIRDGLSEAGRQNLTTEPDARPGWFLGGLQEVTTPISGVMSAREATQTYRNDERVQLLNFLFNGNDPNARFFATVVFECPESVALSWGLSKQEVERIKKGFGDGKDAEVNNQRMDALAEWWSTDQRPVGGRPELPRRQGHRPVRQPRPASAR